ncbi:hypothetical protein [Salinicoccus roseus]|uniref:hypothetical protein n=1 Tax=Salinicoccus roseus TaxID=45670 RepID=UPI0023003345|nr:hypothetical protein [Salinicoccus roseus]
MNISRFELYESLWTKSLTAFATENNLSYEHLKQSTQEHDVPLPSPKYLYHYRRGNQLTKTRIKGENYIINLKEKVSKSAKFYDKWSYFDKDKIEELLIQYERISVPDNVSKFHTEIDRHKKFIKEEKRNHYTNRYRIDERSSIGLRDRVINTNNISEKSLPKFYLLCHTLFKAVEGVGAVVRVTDNSTSILIDDYEISLSFKEKHKRVKNREDQYPTFNLVPRGMFKCEIKGLCPWHRYNYGIDKNFNGDYNNTDLSKLIFERIFELPKLIDEFQADYIKNEAEKEQKRVEQEKLLKMKENEFERIKQLIFDYKLHKELEGLKDYIEQKLNSLSDVEKRRWYKATIAWLTDYNKIDKPLDEKNHNQLIEYLLDEHKNSSTKYSESSIYW